MATTVRRAFQSLKTGLRACAKPWMAARSVAALPQSQHRFSRGIHSLLLNTDRTRLPKILTIEPQVKLKPLRKCDRMRLGLPPKMYKRVKRRLLAAKAVMKNNEHLSKFTGYANPTFTQVDPDQDGGKKPQVPHVWGRPRRANYKRRLRRQTLWIRSEAAKRKENRAKKFYTKLAEFRQAMYKRIEMKNNWKARLAQMNAAESQGKGSNASS